MPAPAAHTVAAPDFQPRSAFWYLLSAFAVISYTENPVYVAFAAAGSWLGAFISMTWLHRDRELVTPRHDPP